MPLLYIADSRVYSDIMPEDQTEVTVVELRQRLADVLEAAYMDGTVTYVTRRGRRIATVSPLVRPDCDEESPQ